MRTVLLTMIVYSMTQTHLVLPTWKPAICIKTTGRSTQSVFGRLSRRAGMTEKHIVCEPRKWLRERETYAKVPLFRKGGVKLRANVPEWYCSVCDDPTTSRQRRAWSLGLRGVRICGYGRYQGECNNERTRKRCSTRSQESSC